MAAIQIIPAKEEVYEHAFADGTNRFAIDNLLRQHGFRLMRRKPKEEPMWSKDGEIYLQTQAEEQLPKGELRLAWMRQNAYYNRHCEDLF